jgi:uncharacterized membrane protein
MKTLAALALTALALAACTPAETPQPPADAPPTTNPPPSETPATLNGVDLTQPLRGTGTEPFWGFEIDQTQVKHFGPDRPDQTAPNPGPVMTATSATWTVKTADGANLKIVLTPGPCSDGMSDRVYPLNAVVDVEKPRVEQLKGCAASKAAFDKGGESGPVQ